MPVVVATTDVDTDLVYDPQGPVDDIEGYPSVVYDGVTVYYVEGRWYRQGRGGWGYYRDEPRELGRQREMHDRDPRWARSPEAPVRAEPARPGVAERQAPEGAVRPRQTEVPVKTAAPGKTAPPVKTAQPVKAAAPAKKRAPARKGAPAGAGSTRENEERR